MKWMWDRITPGAVHLLLVGGVVAAIAITAAVRGFKPKDGTSLVFSALIWSVLILTANWIADGTMLDLNPYLIRKPSPAWLLAAIGWVALLITVGMALIADVT